jgi:hypothetical protein
MLMVVCCNAQAGKTGSTVHALVQQCVDDHCVLPGQSSLITLKAASDNFLLASVPLLPAFLTVFPTTHQHACTQTTAPGWVQQQQQWQQWQQSSGSSSIATSASAATSVLQQNFS